MHGWFSHSLCACVDQFVQQSPFLIVQVHCIFLGHPCLLDPETGYTKSLIKACLTIYEPRIMQFTLLTYIAILVVALAATRYQQPELRRSRSMAIAQ